MKKFWCLLLITLMLFGCTAEPDAPIGRITPAPEAASSAALAEATPDAETTPEPTVPATPASTAAPTLSPEERLYAYIAGMTVEEKIGQLCMFGFSGTKEISAEFKKILQEYRIGSVILYGQNIADGNRDGGFQQCRALTDSVRNASAGKIPLLFSTDVEGGKVRRFGWSGSLLSARSLGKKDSTETARRQFRTVAEGLLRAGINVDLAPCLDIAKNPDGTFLGNRIISTDQNVAARIGRACIEGLHEGGCLSIVKHFPGHGATSADSHESTPIVQKSYDALYGYDLVPFCEALGTADGVMVAHISYPNVDAAHIASQSSVFITDILRGELGFEGIVMSDDFRMAGLRKQTTLSDGAVQFILAGGDLILCGANHTYQRAILKGLYDAVGDGTIDEQRLNESVYRILSAKMRVTGWDPLKNDE